MLSYNVLNSWVEKMMKKSLPVKIKTSDITNLSTKDINKLKAGDIVLKKTGNQKHAYIVSYKEDNQGICITYNDALYTETVSYDYDTTTKTWVYNSTDKTVIQKELTAGDNVTITDAGVISATDTTYTAGTGITITDGVISAQGGGNLYEHQIRIFSNQIQGIVINIGFTFIDRTSTQYTSNPVQLIYNRFAEGYLMVSGYVAETIDNVTTYYPLETINSNNSRIICRYRDTSLDLFNNNVNFVNDIVTQL